MVVPDAGRGFQLSVSTVTRGGQGMHGGPLLSLWAVWTACCVAGCDSAAKAARDPAPATCRRGPGPDAVSLGTCPPTFHQRFCDLRSCERRNRLAGEVVEFSSLATLEVKGAEATGARLLQPQVQRPPCRGAARIQQHMSPHARGGLARASGQPPGHVRTSHCCPLEVPSV